jgi:hypothetical protein
MRLDLMLDCNNLEVMSRFWSAALGYEIAPPDPDDPDVVLRHPTDPAAPKLWLQRVAEPKTAKNRLHLDITTEDMHAETQRLLALGATRVPGPAFQRWEVLADPEGNELCSCQE